MPDEDDKALVMKMGLCSGIFTINVFSFTYALCLSCRKPLSEQVAACDDERIYDCPF